MNATDFEKYKCKGDNPVVYTRGREIYAEGMFRYGRSLVYAEVDSETHKWKLIVSSSEDLTLNELTEIRQKFLPLDILIMTILPSVSDGLPLHTYQLKQL